MVITQIVVIDLSKKQSPLEVSQKDPWQASPHSLNFRTTNTGGYMALSYFQSSWVASLFLKNCERERGSVCVCVHALAYLPAFPSLSPSPFLSQSCLEMRVLQLCTSFSRWTILGSWSFQIYLFYDWFVTFCNIANRDFETDFFFKSIK